MSGCICEILSLYSLDEESTTSSTTDSSDLPALENVTKICADLVEALDRALYINEAAEFQQKPCVCNFSAQPAMESSNGCMFCCDQTVRCAACTSASVADENAIDAASSLISGTVTISSVVVDDNGAFEFTSSVVDVDALAACLEASDAVNYLFVMVGSASGRR